MACEEPIMVPPAQTKANAQICRHWSALQDAASAIGMMAGVPAEEADTCLRNVPASIRDMEPWKRELARNQISDISAMLQPGLAALLAASARGQDASVPALTLWLEFKNAREALLKLLPQSGTLGPQRAA